MCIETVINEKWTLSWSTGVSTRILNRPTTWLTILIENNDIGLEIDVIRSTADQRLEMWRQQFNLKWGQHCFTKPCSLVSIIIPVFKQWGQEPSSTLPPSLELSPTRHPQYGLTLNLNWGIQYHNSSKLIVLFKSLFFKSQITVRPSLLLVFNLCKVSLRALKGTHK